MANKTRMQHSSSATIYHRISASNDAPEHDVATSEALAQGLGSSADFQIHSSDSITCVANHQLVTTIDELDAGAGGSSTSCTVFIWIKNSGFQDANKTIDCATGTTLRIAFENDATHYISLNNGESILFHNPGGGLVTVDGYWASTSTGTVYAEVICATTND